MECILSPRYNIAFTVYLKAVGIFNCAGKCTAKAMLYRGDNGKHNGMHIIAETEEETFESNEDASPEPMELNFNKSVQIKEGQKYTIELLQKNENGLKITFSKAAMSKNGTSVNKGAIPTLYFDV